MELWEFGIFWQASVCGMGVLYSCNIFRPADSTICGSTLYNLSQHSHYRYMVQLVNLAACYLSAPLLNNAGFAASSSRIWQGASYADSRPASHSEEYPLFLPRQGGHGTFVDGNSGFSKSVGSNFGLSSMENLRSVHLGSRGTLVNYRGASSSP